MKLAATPGLTQPQSRNGGPRAVRQVPRNPMEAQIEASDRRMYIVLFFKRATYDRATHDDFLGICCFVPT